MRPSQPTWGPLSATSLSPSIPQHPVLSSLGWKLSPGRAGGLHRKVWVSETTLWSLSDDQLRPPRGWKEENDQGTFSSPGWVCRNTEATGARVLREPALSWGKVGVTDDTCLDLRAWPGHPMLPTSPQLHSEEPPTSSFKGTLEVCPPRGQSSLEMWVSTCWVTCLPCPAQAGGLFFAEHMF